jgi:hypothetical protein
MSDQIEPPISAREKQDRQVREAEEKREAENRRWVEIYAQAEEDGTVIG